MNESSRPHQLAPPGAGLPWLELHIAQAIFYTGFRLSDYDRASRMFVEEERRILNVLDRFDEHEREKLVLIRRLRGLEDSSRYWSAYMTLSHLAIVNHRIVQTILSLLDGKVPTIATSIADVKPSPVGRDALYAFREASSKFKELSRTGRDLRTTLRFAHPWFGALDGSAWHFLAGFHMRLHRRQMEAIFAKVRSNGETDRRSSSLVQGNS